MNLQPKFLELLNKRGLHTEEEITEFLSAKPQKTYDPFLLLNMEAGVDFLLSSIENDEMICIYGDYDADGITSTAVLMEVLSHLTDRLTYYIPSRFEEGYGLNCKALDKIKAAGVDT
ncbi:MAG: DHH family phosphoesterase, partial [Emergencia sp.]